MRKLRFAIATLLLSAGLGLAADLAAEENRLLDLAFPEPATGWLLMDFAPLHRAYSGYVQGGTGFTIDFGVNLGRFFSDKLIFAPYCGLEPSWGNAYAPGFAEALAADYTPRSFNSMPEGMSRVDYWSLERASRIVDYMAKGVTTGNHLSFRYGLALQLPWRYVPCVRVYGLFGSFGVYSTGKTGDAYGRAYGGALYGPSFSGYGAEIELWKGYRLLSDEAASIYAGTLRLGFEYANIADAEIWSADEISGFRQVKLPELVGLGFLGKHVLVPSVWLALSFAVR